MIKHYGQILTITSTLQRYDGDTEPDFVFQLTKRLQENFPITVITPNFYKTRRSKPATKFNIIWFRYFLNFGERLAYEGGIPSKLTKNRLYYLLVPFFVAAELIYTVTFLRKHNTKLIHAHWLIPQGIVAILAKKILRNRVPLLVTLHGADLYTSTNSIVTSIKSAVLRESDYITVVSNAMKKDVLTLCPGAQVAVAPMGVDFGLFHADSNTVRRDFEILFVGRLVEKKGVTYLIEAISGLQEQFPQITLRIIGDGPQRYKLETQAEKSGIGSRVTFDGALSSQQVSSAFARATLCVVPSITAESGDREGLGLVTIEAMASCCPVIASDYNAVKDIIVDGVNGCIFKQKDVTALNASISILLTDPRLRDKLSKNALETARENFSWDVCSERYIKIYSSLIGT